VAEHLTPDPSSEAAADAPDRAQALSSEQLAELRRILVGREAAEIEEIWDRLERLAVGPEEVGEVLPDAIVYSTQRDQRLSKALAPTLEEAIKQSVRRNPGALAEAIFPVLGPAIRKAISQAMSGLIQAINTATQHNLSWRGFKWRMEAMRTGVPFAQVVLRHTLVYSVDQVFLIDRDTGLVLCQAAAEAGIQQDADLVSSMLTAIQDFMADSFGVERESGLRTFSVGEFTVRVEQGPHAVIAAVVRGHAPNELTVVLQDAIETVHLEFGKELTAFEGDAAPFELARPILDGCLQMQVAERKERGPFLSRAVLAILVIVFVLVAAWAFVSVRTARRWSGLVERLRATPGIVVTEAERHRGRFVLTGLRDPLAADPATLIAESKLDVDDVRAQWEHYASFDPQLVEARSRHVLQPPPNVSLDARDGTLYASGIAPQSWIAAAERLAPTIPGVTGVDLGAVRVGDAVRVADLRRDIESQVVLFGAGSATIGVAQGASLDAIAPRIRSLQDEMDRLGQAVAIEILGRTDASGSESTNRLLSEQRAIAVRDALVSRGVAPAGLGIVPLAADDPLPGNATAARQQRNRSVTFRVLLTQNE
jgi:OOP family OmpA-OmpF porin